MNPQKDGIPAVSVPINYLNDPKTESIIFGDELVEGMVVVLEDILFRANPDASDSTDPYEQRKIHDTALWCKVTRLRRRYESITFVGEYADGSEVVRKYDTSHSWYVKKASLPHSE